jgi:hypothetical protein
MPKTITLRLDDKIYDKLQKAASYDNRSISNLIETLALRRLEEDNFANDIEMREIVSNVKLMKKLKKGHLEAKSKKGKLLG